MKKTTRQKSQKVVTYHILDVTAKQARAIGGKFWEIWKAKKLEKDVLDIVLK